MRNKIIGAVAGLALILSIIGLVGGHQSGQTAGGVSNYDTLAVTGLKVGAGCNDAFSSSCTVTTFAKLIGTSCNLIGTDSSQAASTTVAYDCAVTGVTSTDNVIAQLATSTTRLGLSSFSQWFISAAKASSTAGFVTVLLNNAGNAAVPSATNVGSSTAVFVFK